MERVTVICDRQDPEHDRKGTTRVETFARLSAPDLHGHNWRTVDPQRGARNTRVDGEAGPTSLHQGVTAALRTRRSGEVVLSPDGEVLDGSRRGRTRSAPAARTGWNMDHGRGALEVSPEADAYANALADGGRVVVQLRCRVCRLDVPVRLERLDPVLDRLAAAGLEVVKLEMLRRILES